MPSPRMALTIALVSLGTIALVTLFQRKVMPVPVVGSVLPR